MVDLGIGEVEHADTSCWYTTDGTATVVHIEYVLDHRILTGWFTAGPDRHSGEGTLLAGLDYE